MAKSNCCITVQLKDVDLSSDALVQSCCEQLVPLVRQEMRTAMTGPKSKGCTVSGSASGGAGGVGGSVTVTCTI